MIYKAFIILSLIVVTAILLPYMIIGIIAIPFIKYVKRKEDEKLLLRLKQWLQLKLTEKITL